MAVFCVITVFLLLAEFGILRYINFRQKQYDKVTGLYTQYAFEKKARKMLLDQSKNYSLVKSDILDFNSINNLYGRKGGDEVLRWYANLLRASCDRKTGIPGKAVICRAYGDQFYVLREIESQEQFIADLNVTLTNYKKDRLIVKRFYNIQIRSGIVFTGCDYGAPAAVDDLMCKAYYAAQKCGYSSADYEIFNWQLQEQLDIDEKIGINAVHSFANHEFSVFYQPKIDLATGNITGAEALTRWNHPGTGNIMPDIFIPLFEKYGLIIKLDFFVLDTVLRFLQDRIEHNQHVVPISINMSRRHFTSLAFLQQFNDIFTKYHVPAELVEIEILERAMSEYNEGIFKDIVYSFHNKGFKLSIDDFGTGESTLNMLGTIPVDIIKLDRKFLSDIPKSQESAKVLTKMVELAKDLGMKSICEGAETEQDISFLKSIKCDQVQGFYYSRPLAECDFSYFLSSHPVA